MEPSRGIPRHSLLLLIESVANCIDEGIERGHSAVWLFDSS